MFRTKRKLRLDEVIELAESGELEAVLDEMGVPPVEMPVGPDEPRPKKPFKRSDTFDRDTFNPEEYARDLFMK